jgi:hypothetical protein
VLEKGALAGIQSTFLVPTFFTLHRSNWAAAFVPCLIYLRERRGENHARETRNEEKRTEKRE